MSFKREFTEFAFGNNGVPNESDPTDDGSARKKKRKSRWATDEEEKTFIPGMPTVLPPGLEKDQEELYLLQLQIEEISRRLRTGDLGIPANPEERSPSPEPIYNNEGKRLNTREYRTRKKLEEQRHDLIQRCCMLNTEYKPPSDYKPPVVKVTDKVMIPQEEHPDINFVGLLIGPRGNTLKNLEKETGAKIIIRGKGSVKEGKIGRKDGQPLPGEDEPLHAYITANNPEHVRKASDKIKDIIKQGIEVPEQQNDLRRQQLRELALLNGTLRENDGLMKLKQLQQAQTIITNTIICSKCGGTGHLSQDCKQARPSDTLRNMSNPPIGLGVDKAKMDSEYSALMAELGEGPPNRENSSSGPPHPPQRNSFGQNRPHFSTPPGVPPPGPPPMSQPPPFHQPPHNRPPGPPPSHNQHQQSNTFQSQPPHNGPPPNMPPSSMPQHIPGGPPPPMSMSQPPPMSMSQPPPLMSQHTQPTQPPMSSGGSLPWQQQQQQQPPMNSGPPGMPPQVSSSNSMGMPPPHHLGAPPPPPPPNSHNMPPWQQQQQHHGQQSNYGMPPPPQCPPWQQPPGPPMGPPPPGPPHGNIPPWHHGPPQGPPPPHMGGPPPPHMMPPPPPPGQNFNAAPPPPPPGHGGDSGLPPGIPLGVPPPPPPS